MGVRRRTLVRPRRESTSFARDSRREVTDLCRSFANGPQTEAARWFPREIGTPCLISEGGAEEVAEGRQRPGWHLRRSQDRAPAGNPSLSRSCCGLRTPRRSCARMTPVQPQRRRARNGEETESKGSVVSVRRFGQSHRSEVVRWRWLRHSQSRHATGIAMTTKTIGRDRNSNHGG